MTPESQRIAIAEACGWKVDSHYFGDAHWHKGQQLARMVQELPDYLSDLNAMHEAEKVLTERQQLSYRIVLADMVNFVVGNNIWPLIHLTAAQRAEAFLRTIGKWDDSL